MADTERQVPETIQLSRDQGGEGVADDQASGCAC